MNTRKRRVDELILAGGSTETFRRLSNGKLVCLVCPHCPVLDSPLLLSMHKKGSRHIAAESKLMEREISREAELNKRIALSAHSTGESVSGTHMSEKKCLKVQSKPLLEHTWNAIQEVQRSRSGDQNASNCLNDVVHGMNSYAHASSLLPSVHNARVAPQTNREITTMGAPEAAGSMPACQNLMFSELREKELKFTAGGWKRDCHGKWYRDENVEFDSDEEDPNVCFN